jgi:hypothetical protein
MGEWAIERLLARIGGAAGQPETRLLPTELVVRASTDIRARDPAFRPDRVRQAIHGLGVRA